MKVSLLSFAAIASMASTASAHPWIINDIINGVKNDLGNLIPGLNPGSSDGSQLNGRLSSGLKDLASLVNNIEPAKLANLGQQIKWGMGNVTEMAAKDGITFGKAPDNILNAQWGSLKLEDIYQAFQLDRSDNSRVGIKIWGPAEDADHPFIPPGPGDLRGPCPGLNTAANHGYLPRNGVVNPVQLFIGTWQALSLSPDLCAILAVLAFIFKGDLTTMTLSIGGQHGLGGGLSSHGVLEGDASVTRNDTYLGQKVGGNGWEVVPAKVELLKQEAANDITPITLANSRYRAWQESRQLNPQFDFNPWRMIVAYGESGFVMENLRGEQRVFTQEMIDYWFIKNRFPPGWSRRAIPMTTPEIVAWAALIELIKPTLPGWSFGVPGLFLPLPTLNGLNGLFTGLAGGNAPNTIKGVGCAVAGAFLGWMPTTLTSLVGDLGISSANGFSC